MKRFFAFLLIIFMIGLACSLVPLTLSIPLHHTANTLHEIKSVPSKDAEDTDSLLTPEHLLLKGEVKVTPSPMPPETANPEMDAPGLPDSGAEDLPVDTFQPAYSLQMLEPIFTTNFAHPQLGCDWVGIAGQVFDVAGQPVDGLVITVTRDSDETVPAVIAYSGLALLYGPGGFEAVLGNRNDGGVYQLQLFDSTGNPLSAISEITIPAGCEANLTILNYIDQSKANLIYLPILIR